LENILQAKKVVMGKKLVIQTFETIIPVNGQSVNLSFYLFGRNGRNTPKNSSYSIIAKINGINYDSASAEVIADYGPGKRITDYFLLHQNQLIYSNEGTTIVSFIITIRIKAIFSRQGITDAVFQAKLYYNLRNFSVHGIQSEFCSKNILQEKLARVR
jgi:hypothetical protein